MDERVAPVSGSSEIGDTAWNVKFTNVTFIVTRTFSRCCRSPVARARDASGRVGATLRRKAEQRRSFYAKTAFCPVPTCVRSTHSAAVITSPRWVDAVCRDSAYGSRWRGGLWPRVYCTAGCRHRQYILAVSADPSRRDAAAG